MVTPNSLGIYLYGIIPTREQIIFDVTGADADHDEVYSIPHDDPQTAPSAEPALSLSKCSEQALQQAQGASSRLAPLLHSRWALAAVVSASPLPDYHNLKRNEAARYLVAHQRVVETVMQDFPILPAKFGTVLADEAQVRRLMAQGEALFQSALHRLAGRVQMEVVVLWNPQQIFQEISQEELIIRLKAQVADRPPEETVAERVVIGQLVQSSLERRRAALRDYLLPPLQEIALDIVANPLMDDSMVANIALLVDKDGLRALDRCLEALDAEFEGGKRPAFGNIPLHFRCVGPLPPYSFATVEVQAPSFEAVDGARRCLGLEETATHGEIKQAYRCLAGRLHPDHNPNAPQVEDRMAELTQAYQFLTTYAENQALSRVGEQGSGDGEPYFGTGTHLDTLASQHPCSFSRQAVEQTLFPAIRRQEALV